MTFRSGCNNDCFQFEHGCPGLNRGPCTAENALWYASCVLEARERGVLTEQVIRERTA